jgi:hypothetical protein
MAFVWMASLPVRVSGDTDLFQKAVNYVFTGTVDPQEAPKIVDRNSCVVEVRDPKFKRYIRYFLNRFKMDGALYTKKYVGRRVNFELHVTGDDVIIEYLSFDRQTVTLRFRSAKIPLLGDIEQTKKALQIIFADYCKAQQRKGPF